MKNATPHKPHNLADKLAFRLLRDGPLSVHDYMAACLYDDEFGYYRRAQAIGAQGDFITAPEISQLFGELIGIWAVTQWRQMGGPAPFNLIEPGPGRGTLMADVLRTAKVDPAFIDAVCVHLVETSETLRAAQVLALNDAPVQPVWHENLATVPAGTSIVIANEFLDALPLRQFVRHDGHWVERMVDFREGEFVFVPGDEEPAPDDRAYLKKFHGQIEGEIVEICPHIGPVAKQLGRLASKHPLCGLFIDYGHETSAVGETLQAVRAHGFANVLQYPGETDLTAHVDFEAFGSALRRYELTPHGPISQAKFLADMGIAARGEKLLQNATDRQAEQIKSAIHRLTDASQMGTLFKVIAATSKNLCAPVPFDDK